MFDTDGRQEGEYPRAAVLAAHRGVGGLPLGARGHVAACHARRRQAQLQESVPSCTS